MIPSLCCKRHSQRWKWCCFQFEERGCAWGGSVVDKGCRSMHPCSRILAREAPHAALPVETAPGPEVWGRKAQATCPTASDDSHPTDNKQQAKPAAAFLCPPVCLLGRRSLSGLQPDTDSFFLGHELSTLVSFWAPAFQSPLLRIRDAHQPASISILTSTSPANPPSRDITIVPPPATGLASPAPWRETGT